MELFPFHLSTRLFQTSDACWKRNCRIFKAILTWDREIGSSPCRRRIGKEKESWNLCWNICACDPFLRLLRSFCSSKSLWLQLGYHLWHGCCPFDWSRTYRLMCFRSSNNLTSWGMESGRSSNHFDAFIPSKRGFQETSANSTFRRCWPHLKPILSFQRMRQEMEGLRILH